MTNLRKPSKKRTNQLYRSKLTTGQRTALQVLRKELQLIYKERKIKNANKHIDQLFRSVYHGQFNDYVMVNIKGRDVPVDAQLGPVVKELVSRGFWAWSNGIELRNLRSGLLSECAYIILASNPTKYKNFDKPRNALIDKLQQALKKCKTKVIRRKPFEVDANRRHLKNITFLPNVVVIAANGPDTVSLQFKLSYLPSVHRALNVRENTDQVLPGGANIKGFAQLYQKLPLPKDIEPCEFYNATCFV
jgi:hypothetical protein